MKIRVPIIFLFCVFDAFQGMIFMYLDVKINIFCWKKVLYPANAVVGVVVG